MITKTKTITKTTHLLTVAVVHLKGGLTTAVLTTAVLAASVATTSDNPYSSLFRKSDSVEFAHARQNESKFSFCTRLTANLVKQSANRVTAVCGFFRTFAVEIEF